MRKIKNCRNISRAIFLSLCNYALSKANCAVRTCAKPSRNNEEARAYHTDWHNYASDEDWNDRRFLRGTERSSQKRASALSVEAEMHGRRGRRACFRDGTNTIDPVATVTAMSSRLRASHCKGLTNGFEISNTFTIVASNFNETIFSEVKVGSYSTEPDLSN